MLSNFKNKDKENYLKQEVLNFDIHSKISLNGLNTQSDIFYDTLVKKEKIESIMHKASTTTDAKKLSLYREQLKDTLTKDYLYLKNRYNIRQFHFHLPNSISFLRFHRENKYGDSLVEVRPSINYVNQTKKRVKCFEEGKIFNSFRNVYPIFYKNKFVGSVEISYSFLALKNNLTKVEKASYIFLVNSFVAGKKLFKDENFRYETSAFDGYSYDKDTLKDDMKFNISTLMNINKKITDVVKNKFKEERKFSVIYKDKKLFNNNIIISFIPIPNINHKVVAYMIDYRFATIYDLLEDKFHSLFYILTFSSLLISLFIFYILYSKDKKHEKTHYIATHDMLTSIYNRIGGVALIEQEMKKYFRYKNISSLIFFDIDFFKKINDNYGHEKGDFILKELAKVIKNNIRTSDIFVRWGGEEFIIFLPETEFENANKLAKKLCEIVSKYNFTLKERVTCSFGVTTIKEDDSLETLTNRADEALYKAKDNGRNRVESNL